MQKEDHLFTMCQMEPMVFVQYYHVAGGKRKKLS